MKPAASGVLLVRVDNRLVHGQVLEAWVPALEAQGILVADDEAASNVLARSAMALAIHPRLKFEVLPLAAAADLLRQGGKGPPSPRTLVLLRDVGDAAALKGAGVAIPQLNLGNVHFRDGRKQVSQSIFLDGGELEVLGQLAAEGTVVEARAVPSEQPLTLDALRARYRAL